jgi:hypothetical protein
VSDSRALEDEFLAFYELYYWRHNKVPGPTELALEFACKVSDEEYVKLLSKPENFLQLIQHEVPLPNQITPRLRPKQLELIRTLLDPSDKRTLQIKLKVCEVSSAQYQNWLNDPLFSSILYEETSKSTNASRHQVLSALSAEAAHGNVPAIKLYLEMSGEYTPRQQNVGSESEFKTMTLKLLEVLKRHVDEQTLMKIRAELEEVLFGEASRVRTVIKRSPVDFRELY